MQLLGNTDKQKMKYKTALMEAKKSAGASFDLQAFNSSWLATHEDIKADAGRDVLEVIEDTIQDTENKMERVTGQIIDSSDVAGAGDDVLREIVRDVVGAIDNYKLNNEIVSFSKVKNGTIQFSACLMQVCDTVIKPSRILKRAPYMDKNINNSNLSNNNAYDTDRLIQFIGICKRLCAREGLCFNRSLYMDLTGVSSEYLRGGLDRLTSSRVDLWQKVLDAEFNQSINFAYNSDIGNMRNLNEGEAVMHRDNTQSVQAVDLSALRRLDMH